MAAYKDLVGQKITKVTSNPGEPKTGQMWYNSTDGSLRGLGVVEAWASASPLITARRTLGASGNDRDASLAFGGGTGSPLSTSVLTEEYSGNGWTTGGSLNTSRYILDGAGTQTSGVAFGGATTPPFANNASTEEYNGSSWTASNNLNTARYNLTGLGTQTAALAFGRDNPSDKGNTEEYNGTSWTAANPMNTGRYSAAGSGTQTAALGSGGYSTTFSNDVEDYDGTNWTTLPANLGTARYTVEGSKGGTTSSALVFGGGIPPGSTKTVATEFFDGTSFTSKPNMATAVGQHGGVGTATSAMSFGGQTPSASTGTAQTEEFTQSTNTITAAAFSSGGVMPEATSSVADGGTATAAVKGAGQKNNPDSTPTSSAEYNGTSWTTGNTVPAPYGSTTGGTGTQTALITGGKGSGSTINFEYDGTNWTTGGSLGTGRYQGKNLGTQTAAAYCGGRVSPPTLNNVEEYDGSSWTSVTAMPIAIRNGGGYGIQTAGVIVSGFQGPSSSPVSPASSVSRAALGFNYDGTNWTTGTSSNIAGASGGAAGIQTVGFFLAGENPALSPSSILTSQTYDGTSYTTSANTTRSRATNFGITSSRTSAVGNAAAIFGGTDPAATPNDTAATEAYSVETVAANITDFTTS